MPNFDYAAQPELTLDGQVAPEDLMAALQQIVLEESLSVPSQLVATFYNPFQSGRDEDFFKCSQGSYDQVFAIGKKIKLKFSNLTTASTEFSDQIEEQVFEGEIVAVESHFTSTSQAPFIVKAQDVSHRLYRGTHIRSFQNMTDADIVSKIIGEVGISPGKIDSTGGPYGYDDVTNASGYSFQYNQSNMSFLRQLASRNGFECFVQDGKLHFRQPHANETLTLKWLESLSNFSVRVSSAEQVSEVEVRGWDYAKKELVIARANDEKILTQTKYGEGAKTSQSFAGKPDEPKLFVTAQPIVNNNQAGAMAQSLFNEVSGEFVNADADAPGNPAIRPGRLVDLKDLGPYTGKYYVTATRHVYQERLYTTEFSVRGLRGGDLFSLMADSIFSPAQSPLMVGIVTNNKDPKGWGRVRVKLPSLSEEHETYWARMVAIGAGNNRGFDCLPEVNDEVLVGFEQGDIQRPYILGGVWNGKDPTPEKIGDSVVDGKVRLRTFKTRIGHALQFVDEDKDPVKKGVHLTTEGGHKVHVNDSDQFIHIQSLGDRELKLDDRNRKVTLTTPGGQTLEMVDAGDKISLTSQNGSIEISAPQGITLKSGVSSIDIKPSGITIKSSASVSMEGSMTTVKGSAMLILSGGLVKIN